MSILIQQESTLTKKIAKRMLKYLEDKNMAWCFDEQGILWTREALEKIITNA